MSASGESMLRRVEDIPTSTTSGDGTPVLANSAPRTEPGFGLLRWRSHGVVMLSHQPFAEFTPITLLVQTTSATYRVETVIVRCRSVSPECWEITAFQISLRRSGTEWQALSA